MQRELPAAVAVRIHGDRHQAVVRLGANSWHYGQLKGHMPAAVFTGGDPRSSNDPFPPTQAFAADTQQS